METQSRERISVDLQGLKPALLARLQAQGVSPSDLVRKTLEQTLGVPTEAGEGVDLRPSLKQSSGRARLCLRMERDGAMAVVAAAKRAGMSPGDYVAGLVAGVPVLLNGGSRSEHIEALSASSFHLSSLSRDIHTLTRLLTQANVAQARVYRNMLDALEGDVRRHLCSPRGRWLHLGSQDRQLDPADVRNVLQLVGAVRRSIARSPFCSDSRRWELPGELMMMTSKRPLGVATGAGLYGACTRYSGRRASATWQALRHRPLPLHSDWRYRPEAEVAVSR